MPRLFYEFWHIAIGLASGLLGRGSTPEMTDFPFEFWLIATGMASGLLGAAVASRSKLVRKVASLDRDLRHKMASVPVYPVVISYHPGYQSVLRDLKPSTKQRFVAIAFDLPAEEVERRIVAKEVPNAAPDIVNRLVAIGRKARALKDHGLDEAASTRAPVHAAGKDFDQPLSTRVRETVGGCGASVA